MKTLRRRIRAGLSPGEKNYLVINLILAGMILGILVYSGIFSAARDNHPIPSFYEKATGQPSPSRGLSNSFSEIVRLRFASAREYNPQGIPVFLFFLAQLLLRFLVSTLILFTRIRKGLLAVPDTLVSVLLFALCFRDYIRLWIEIF